MRYLSAFGAYSKIQHIAREPDIAVDLFSRWGLVQLRVQSRGMVIARSSHKLQKSLQAQLSTGCGRVNSKHDTENNLFGFVLSTPVSARYEARTTLS